MPKKPPPPFGLTLTILRRAQGWSQRELAKAAGLSSGSLISEYEIGATELTRDQLEMLAAILGWQPGTVDRVLLGFGLMQPDANARRVANDLPAAEGAFSSAWMLWKEGASADPGLLAESRLLDLEASLRRAQRRFAEALDLHDQTLAAAQAEEIGHFLLNKSATLEQSGDFERSFETLEHAARLVHGEPSRLLWVLRFNQAVNLLHLGWLTEAEPRLAEARELAIRLSNELDLVRVLWLEGRIATFRENHEEAVAIFEQVRREFATRRMAYDFALVSLELAALYLKRNRTGEVKTLAQQMVTIFNAQEVHREASVALKLFCKAAEREDLTVELTRRLVEYLTKARHDPKLRFEL